jgi:hypothetical protein
MMHLVGMRLQAPLFTDKCTGKNSSQTSSVQEALFWLRTKKIGEFKFQKYSLCFLSLIPHFASLMGLPTLLHSWEVLPLPACLSTLFCAWKWLTLLVRSTHSACIFTFVHYWMSYLCAPKKIMVSSENWKMQRQCFELGVCQKILLIFRSICGET